MKIDFDEPPQQQFLPTCKRPASEEAVISLEVKKLLSKSVIEPTGHSQGEIISDVFVRIKKDGGHRMILNLKNLNQYAIKLHFKMDTLHTIIKLVEKDCFMASISLNDAQVILEIFWREELYQLTCLPNGLWVFFVFYLFLILLFTVKQLTNYTITRIHYTTIHYTRLPKKDVYV